MDAQYTRNLKKVSQIFLGIVKCFVGFNFFMLGFAIYNMIQSPDKMFRTHFWLFLLFLGNFWLMLFFLLVLSLCMKICMLSYEPNLQDIPRLWPLLHSFLTGEEESEEDIIAHLTLMESEEDNRSPPTNDQLLNLEVKWMTFLIPFEGEIPVENDKCIICLQSLENNVIRLGCDCRNLFHKKCVLEWFYFNEKEEEGGKKKVSCPSCRHFFED